MTRICKENRIKGLDYFQPAFVQTFVVIVLKVCGCKFRNSSSTLFLQTPLSKNLHRQF